MLTPSGISPGRLLRNYAAVGTIISWAGLSAPRKTEQQEDCGCWTPTEKMHKNLGKEVLNTGTRRGGTTRPFLSMD